MVVDIDPIALEMAQVDELIEEDRISCAQTLFRCWHQLWLHATLGDALNLGVDFSAAAVRLGALVARDDIRSRLSPDAQHLIDVHGPVVPRCRHCSAQLDLERERDRGFCTDCGLGFEADVEGQDHEEDDPDVD